MTELEKTKVAWEAAWQNFNKLSKEARIKERIHKKIMKEREVAWKTTGKDIADERVKISFKLRSDAWCARDDAEKAARKVLATSKRYEAAQAANK